jgi:hypothetical protein
MKACANCRMMIDVLKREVDEWSEREQKLARINNTLVEAVMEGERACRQETNWKSKYTEQAKANK